MKILVRYDREKWAFHRRALTFLNSPPQGSTVTIAPDREPREDYPWDAVLFLDCQADTSKYAGAMTAKHIGSHAWLFDPDPNDLRARGVNQHRCRARASAQVSNCDTVIVHNRAQHEFFSTVHPRVVLAPYPVDVTAFTHPGNRQHEKLKVGWCQQVGGGLNCFKGLTDILVPLIATIGDAVEWSVLTPDANTALSTEALAKWYQSLDIFVVTSSAEGGPHGPFEAAACGCAVISTDVGQVSDWKALRECGLLVSTYRNADQARGVVEAMAAKIRNLSEQRDRLRIVSRTLYDSIQQHYNAKIEAPKQLLEMFREE